MAFPTQNTLAIHLPVNLHYNYAYSAESDSPCSPDFPSTPSVYDDAFPSNPLGDIYQNTQDGYPVCTPMDSYNDYSAQCDSLCSPTVAFSSGLPLHAPTPLPGQSPLLRSDPHKFNYPFLGSSQSPLHQSSVDDISQAAPVSGRDISQHPINDDLHYEDPVQITFPTPSELLVELSGRNPNVDQLRVEKKSETRKARRRAVAKSVGFVPTDPDTISSHDKKRHYLECLEHYVMYLHEQLHLVGAEPVHLERVSDYRGLNSRSIRTLLVHMENINRKLNLRTLDEEQRFMTLRDTVCRQDAAALHNSHHQSTSSNTSSVTDVSTNWQW